MKWLKNWFFPWKCIENNEMTEKLSNTRKPFACLKVKTVTLMKRNYQLTSNHFFSWIEYTKIKKKANPTYLQIILLGMPKLYDKQVEVFKPLCWRCCQGSKVFGFFKPDSRQLIPNYRDSVLVKNVLWPWKCVEVTQTRFIKLC